MSLELSGNKVPLFSVAIFETALNDSTGIMFEDDLFVCNVCELFNFKCLKELISLLPGISL